MSLGRLIPPLFPWEGLQDTNFDQCLHIVMVIGKCRRFSGGFFGWEEGLGRGCYVGETFHVGIVMGEEDFHEGDAAFPSII